MSAIGSRLEREINCMVCSEWYVRGEKSRRVKLDGDELEMRVKSSTWFGGRSLEGIDHSRDVRG